MIRVRARIDQDGLLLDFEARGHAGQGPQGSDIVCAAFTVLARTAFSALGQLPGAVVEGRAPRPGDLDFHVEAMPDSERDKALGMSAFLLEGVAALAREYPSGVGLSMEALRRD